MNIKLSWEELTDVRHDSVHLLTKLTKLEMTIRDHFRSANQVNIALDSINQLDQIVSVVRANIEHIDAIIGRHEDE